MLLRDRAELPDHLVTHLDAILAAGHVMGEIVTELSVLAEAGAPRHPSPVPVAAVLEEVLQALAGPLADSGAMVLRDCDPTVAVLSDGLTMRRVLQNLIGNAIKHSDRDTPEVTVSARREGDRVAVAVADDGPGVPSADRERIFGAFERGALPSTEGSGLGLAICRKLVERDGGTLTVEPRAPRGSLFAVRLPAG
jgi:signal transduction histidine kinase